MKGPNTSYYQKRVKLADVSPPDAFHKVHEDRHVSFGDGGDADLDYPVYVCPALGTLDAASLEALAAEGGRVAEGRRDVQQNGVVEDIVDPELFPRFLEPSERRSFVVPDPGEDGLREGSLDRALLVGSDIRGSYAWIPSVVEYAGGRCRFLSAIQNLPRTAANERLYGLLEDALSGLMPTFIAQCKAVARPDGHYNVSVKMQRYVVPPGARYKGQWHTEGVTEGVSAVGVLYTSWPADLEGGQLKFRPAVQPSSGYSEYIEPPPTRSVVVEAAEGTAVAFHNTIPHRFCALTNRTDRTLVRSFVNFFVTSPSLKSMDVVPTNADVCLALLPKLNYDLVSVVLDWLQLTPTSFDAAWDLRDVAKAEMAATKGQWGVINYGNCGQLMFLASGGPSDIEKQIVAKWRAEEEACPTPGLAEKYGPNYTYGSEYVADVAKTKPEEEVRLVRHHMAGVFSTEWREMEVRSHNTSSTGDAKTLDSD